MSTGTVGSTTALPSTSASLGDAFNIGEQKELFLKLLVAQLKNQDPTDPMDQKDMMGQMAQFSTVEQLANMAKTLDTMQANATFTQSVALIGKQVDYLDSGGSIVHDATVNAVSATGGLVKLVLSDGTQVTPSDIVMVH